MRPIFRLVRYHLQGDYPTAEQTNESQSDAIFLTIRELAPVYTYSSPREVVLTIQLSCPKTE
jgi:hypothetical protein